MVVVDDNCHDDGGPARYRGLVIDPQTLATLAASHAPAAVCTVVHTKGSTPRKAGASMIVVDDGSDFGVVYAGTVGGGALEHEIRRRALEVIASMTPTLVEIPLTTVLGMCCGGSVSVFIESVRMRPRLLLFGAGHVGEALCAIASKAGFDVTVVDPRDELRTPARFKDAVAFADSYDHDDDFRALAFARDVFVVVATHDHAVDQRIAAAVCPREFAYAAVVGSRRKAVMMRDRLINRGVDAELVDRLHCPAGLDIHAETPEEIAVSIVAQMVSVRRAASARAKASASSTSTTSTPSTPSTSTSTPQKESA